MKQQAQFCKQEGLLRAIYCAILISIALLPTPSTRFPANFLTGDQLRTLLQGKALYFRVFGGTSCGGSLVMRQESHSYL